MIHVALFCEYCHVSGISWLIIIGSGLDDWIYCQILLQSFLNTIIYNSSQSMSKGPSTLLVLVLQPIHTTSKYTDPHAPKSGEQLKQCGRRVTSTSKSQTSLLTSTSLASTSTSMSNVDAPLDSLYSLLHYECLLFSCDWIVSDLRIGHFFYEWLTIHECWMTTHLRMNCRIRSKSKSKLCYDRRSVGQCVLE
jgi:hypothetical protein